LIFYILVVLGAIMVYGSGMILKLFKLEDSIKALIGIKISGLVVALIGMLKLLNVY